ncbi:heterokaryon incompatibility protein-domain-containing protein [Nemania sp. FL0916]|nr:heterokaryon incompatibility protein-domain-containing protein [Nemania sp. FL0916]
MARRQQYSSKAKITEITSRIRNININLEEFSVECAPSFIALSYAWGTDTAGICIRVNCKPFMIRENLAMALRQLQVLCPEAYIWTDAICIDQSDKAEKSHTVQHMGQIFRAAQTVYAWLGPADPGEQDAGDSSDALWDLLEDLGYLVQDTTNYNGRETNLYFEIETVVDNLLAELNRRAALPPAEGGISTVAFVRFMRRVYWQRIWVLQEVCLARELIFCCGTKTMASKVLAGGLMLLYAYCVRMLADDVNMPITKRADISTAVHCDEAHLMLQLTIGQKKLPPLRDLMARYWIKELPRGMQSTDARDMIYGLLGFATNAEKRSIRADYTKSVQEVFRDAVRELLQQHGWADLLAWAQPAQKCISGLPSWTPDFQSTIHMPMCSRGQVLPSLPQFCAAANLRTTTRTGDIHGAWNLRWQGVVVDTIDELGSLWYPRHEIGEVHRDQKASGPLPPLSSRADIFGHISEAKRLAEKSIASHPSPPRGIPDDELKRLEAVWCVPCADQLSTNYEFIRGGARIQSAYLAALTPMIRDEARPYLNAMMAWVNKRVALSTHGYVGLVPGDTQKDDVIVLLQNCSAPYILRRRSGSESYELVGEAYIWGIMDGEYVPEDGEEVIFDII